MESTFCLRGARVPSLGLMPGALSHSHLLSSHICVRRAGWRCLSSTGLNTRLAHSSLGLMPPSAASGGTSYGTSTSVSLSGTSLKLLHPRTPPAPTDKLMVFLPGTDGTGQAILPQVSYLHAAGYDVYCLYMPPADRSSWQQLTDAATQLISKLLAQPGRSISKVTVLGESFGGILALRLAAAAPQYIDKLVLLNPATSFARSLGGLSSLVSSTNLLSLFPPALYQVSQAALLPLLVDSARLSHTGAELMRAMIDMLPADEELQDKMQVQSPTSSSPTLTPLSLLPEVPNPLAPSEPAAAANWRAGLMRDGGDLPPALLRRVAIPVVLLVSAKDRMLPSLTEGARLQRLLPNACKLILPDSGHAAMLEQGINVVELIRTAEVNRAVSSSGGAGRARAGGAARRVGGGSGAAGAGRAGVSAGAGAAGGSSRQQAAGQVTTPGTAHGTRSSNPANSGTTSAGQAAVSWGGSDQKAVSGSAVTGNGTNGLPGPLPTTSRGSPGRLGPGQAGEGVVVQAVASAAWGKPAPGEATTSTTTSSSTSSSAAAAVPTHSAAGSDGTDVAGGAAGGSWVDNGNGLSSNGASFSQSTSSQGQWSNISGGGQGSVVSGTSGGAAGPVTAAALAAAAAAGLAAGGAGSAQEAGAGNGDVQNIDSFDEWQQILAPWRELVSPVVLGMDNLPEPSSAEASRPMLFVGNHQRVGWYDTPLLVYELSIRGYRVRGLAHPGHWNGPVGPFFEKFGAVKASPMAAFKLLKGEEKVLLFPGGAKEVSKPKNADYTLFWKDEPDFVRMAAKCNALIVPFAAVGADDAYEVIMDAEDIITHPVLGPVARRIYDWWSPDISIEQAIIPITKLPGLGVPSPLPIPNLNRLYFKFEQPIDTAGLRLNLSDKAAVQDLYAKVKSRIEQSMAELLEYRTQDQGAQVGGRLNRAVSDFTSMVMDVSPLTLGQGQDRAKNPQK